LPPQGFALFATSVLAGLFVAFFQLQTLKKPVILDLLLQNPHGFFKIIVMHFDFNRLQTVSPPSFRRLETRLPMIRRQWLFAKFIINEFTYNAWEDFTSKKSWVHCENAVQQHDLNGYTKRDVPLSPRGRHIPRYPEPLQR
jgi:hypothetical protein